MQIPYLDLKRVNAPQESEIKAAIEATIHSGWYLYGEQVRTFQKAWATYNDADYCITTANGLDALTASLLSLKHLRQWADGSEVLVSSLTFIASFEAISRAGLKPVPVDVSEADYLMSFPLAQQSINTNTMAIMPVLIYGRNTDMRPWRTLADEHNLSIVADACQMHGRVREKDAALTKYCDVVAYSFYPGKNLGALGDAGALITNNKEVAEMAEMYCNYGAKEKYHHLLQGANSRMDEIQAAALNVKLKYLDQSNATRRNQAKVYNANIHNPLITLPYGGKEEELSFWHVYPVFTPQRDEFQVYLRNKGIQTQVHYPIPPHKQQAYKELNGYSLPVSERLCKTELSLPLNPALSKPEQDYIVEAINNFAGNAYIKTN